MPWQFGPLKSSMAQIDPKLQDASYTLGAGKISTYYNVIVKLSSPGFIYGAVFLVFILCLKELPATSNIEPYRFSNSCNSNMEFWLVKLFL